MNLAEGATSEALQQQCSFLSDISNHAADSPDNAAGGKECWALCQKTRNGDAKSGKDDAGTSKALDANAFGHFGQEATKSRTAWQGELPALLIPAAELAGESRDACQGPNVYCQGIESQSAQQGQG